MWKTVLPVVLHSSTAIACLSLALTAATPARAFDIEDALTVMDTLETIHELVPSGGPSAAPAGSGGAIHSPRPSARAAHPPAAHHAAYPGLPPAGEKRFEAHLVVVETHNLTAEQLAALARRHRLTVQQSAELGWLQASIRLLGFNDRRSIAAVIRELATDRDVILAQPDYDYRATDDAGSGTTPPATAPATLPQYAADNLHLAQVHAQATGAGVRIGVLDTAIAEHPEIAASVADRFDPIGPTTGDDIGHGTAIAGIIAAHQQMVGVAPAAVLLSARAFTATDGQPPSSTSFVLIQGFDWLGGKNAQVINMSFAGPRDPLLLAEIDKAVQQGIVLVAAAGNDGPKAAADYPGAAAGVLAVTAVDDQQQILPAANRGKYVALAAPGVDVLVALPDGGVGTDSGTSMAAAHVSGAAALILQQAPTLTTAKLGKVLEGTARDLGPKGMDPEFGAGLLDPLAALSALPVKTASDGKAGH